MKSGLALLIGASLSLVLFTSRAAHSAGGVPNLNTRVTNLEAEVPQLDERVGTLEVTVEEQGVVGSTLGEQVGTLQSQMAEVQTELLVLLSNKLLFAVIDADGTIRASRGVQSAAQSVDGEGKPEPGHYDVIFTRDVSACAVTVTAEPQFSSGIIASINGTFRGSPIHDPKRFHVVLSEHDNDRISTRFNIMVMC